MNPQTPKPEPSCPCCHSSNVANGIDITFENSTESKEFSFLAHLCDDCGCQWYQSSRTPATEPTAAVCDTCKGSGSICVGTSGQDSDGNAPEFERCPECGYGEPAAGGEAGPERDEFRECFGSLCMVCGQKKLMNEFEPHTYVCKVGCYPFLRRATMAIGKATYEAQQKAAGNDYPGARTWEEEVLMRPGFHLRAAEHHFLTVLRAYDLRKLDAEIYPPTAQPLPAGGVDTVSLKPLYDAFNIGSAVRTIPTLMQNVSNVIRRSACLSALEDALFMESVPGEHPDEPWADQCALPWGAEPAEYVKAATAWLARSRQSHDGGWLPIEGAPKNADAIDLWCFTEKQDGEDRRETRLADCYWSAGEGWSCFDSTGGSIPIQLLDWTPTHWRYAPGPPAAIASGSVVCRVADGLTPKVAQAWLDHMKEYTDKQYMCGVLRPIMQKVAASQAVDEQ